MSAQAAYQAFADQTARQYGIDAGVFGRLINSESNWNPGAVNGQAKGIAQFTPATAAAYNVNTSDPYSSISGAGAYVADLLKRYGGNYISAIAAYKGVVDKNGNVKDGSYQNGTSYADTVASVTGETTPNGTKPVGFGNFSADKTGGVAVGDSIVSALLPDSVKQFGFDAVVVVIASVLLYFSIPKLLEAGQNVARSAV